MCTHICTATFLVVKMAKWRSREKSPQARPTRCSCCRAQPLLSMSHHWCGLLLLEGKNGAYFQASLWEGPTMLEINRPCPLQPQDAAHGHHGLSRHHHCHHCPDDVGQCHQPPHGE
jgi:hypothetical protein